MKTLISRYALVAMLLQSSVLSSQPVAVRYVEGSLHGFLALRSAAGKIIAAGDLIQVVHGDQVVSRLIFHFQDGSLDDETATFTQRGNFKLISDHHVQKGPVFPKSTDVDIDAASGKVTVHYQDKGRDKVDVQTLNLPPDLANGILIDVIENISPSSKETRLAYVVPTPKARLVELVITPQGEEHFDVAGVPHKATRFNVKVELGGIVGIIAPMLGKQPEDTSVWISGGDAPEFVKLKGPMCLDCPSWIVEMTSPVWQRKP